MQTMKEMVRDNILIAMKPYLDKMTMDMLNQAIVKALFPVDVIESQTLPATQDNTNEYIFKMYMAKKAPKMSKETNAYYLSSVKHLVTFTGKSLININDMDIEYYLQWYRNVGFRGNGNQEATVNNERRNISAFFTWMRKTRIVTENPVEAVEKYQEIEKPIDYLRDWEMEALRDACKWQQDDKVKNMQAYREALRDRALLEFLRSTAILVGECVTIDQKNIDWNRGEVLVYGHKTRRYRKACIDEIAKFHLKKYLDSRTDDNPALFVSLKSPHRRMQKTSIEYVIRAIADRSILDRRVYPHLLRKTTATNMAKKGCPRELVAFYIGHKDGNTKTLNKHYAATDPAQITAAFWQYGAAA